MAVVEAADFAREQELISIQYVNTQIQDICLNCFNTLQDHETEEVSRTWYSFLTGMLRNTDAKLLAPLSVKLVGMVTLATTMTACITKSPSPERLSLIGLYLEGVANYIEFREDQELAQGMTKLRDTYSRVVKSSSNLALCDFRSQMLGVVSSAAAKLWPLVKEYKAIQIHRTTPPSPPEFPRPRPTLPQIPLSDSSDDKSPSDLNEEDKAASTTWLNQARVGGGINQGASTSREAIGVEEEPMEVSSDSEEEEVVSKKKQALMVDSDSSSEKTLRRRISYSHTPSPVPARMAWNSDESDSISDRSRTFKRGAPTNAKYKRPRKTKVLWTAKEEKALIRGIQRFGTGKWKLALLNSTDFHPSRNSGSLKDKYRNLLKHGIL